MTTLRTSSTIQQPDPAARRRSVRWLLIGAGIGALLLLLFEHWLAEVMASGGVRAGKWMVATFACVSALAAVSISGLGAFAWRLGRRVQAARRFPLPGQAVLRPTVVLEGEDALRRASRLRVVGWLLVLLGVALLAASSWLTWRLAQWVGAGAGG